MHPTPSIVVVLLLAVVFTGCLGPGTDKPAPTEGPGPVPTLALEDCDQQLGVFAVDIDQVQAYVPAGFEVLPFAGTGPFTGSGLPGTPGTDATLQLLVQQCTPSSGSGLEANRLGIAQAWVYVMPPVAYQEDGIDAYVLVIWTAVSAADAAERFQHWGLPAHHGEVTLERDPALPEPFQLGTATATQGDTIVVLTTPLLNAVQETVPEHLRLFGVHEREVTGIVDFIEDLHTHQIMGTARLTLESGAAPFPIPDRPGIALHVEPGFAMEWVPQTD